MTYNVTFSFEWEREVTPDEFEYVSLDIEATIAPGRAAVMYLKNGDPGYPAEGAEINELTIKLNGVDVYGQLSPEIIEEIELQALEQADD